MKVQLYARSPMLSLLQPMDCMDLLRELAMPGAKDVWRSRFNKALVQELADKGMIRVKKRGEDGSIRIVGLTPLGRATARMLG